VTLLESVALLRKAAAFPAPLRRRFEALPRRLQAGLEPSPASYSAFEAGLASDRPALLQLNHLHFYRGGPASRDAERGRLKARAVLSAMRTAPVAPGARFALERARAALDGLVALGRAARSPLASFELDRLLGRTRKFTIYGRVCGADASRLLESLGMRASRSLAALDPGRLECAGFDFHDDGRVGAKYYETGPFDPAAVSGRRLRGICERLAGRAAVRDLLRLRRLRRDGTDGPAKLVLRLERGVAFEDLPGLCATPRWEPFWGACRPLLSGLRVFYVGFEGEGVEISARGSPAPWSAAEERLGR
jgi:hypothetical protein